MIKAYKVGDQYYLSGNTYPKRQILLDNNGVWLLEKRKWRVDRKTAELVGAIFHYFVIVEPHCHYLNEERVVVSEVDMKSGYVQLGCDLCDTPYSCGDMVRIVKVLGEA